MNRLILPVVLLATSFLLGAGCGQQSPPAAEEAASGPGAAAEVPAAVPESAPAPAAETPEPAPPAARNLEEGTAEVPEGTAASYANLAWPLARAWQADAGLKGIVYSDLSDKIKLPGYDGYRSWDIRFVSDSTPNVWYSVSVVNGEQKDAQENLWRGGDRANQKVYLETPGIFLRDWNYDSDYVLEQVAARHPDDEVMLFSLSPTALAYDPEIDGTMPEGATPDGTIMVVHLKSGANGGYWSKKRLYFDLTSGQYLGENQAVR